MESFDKNTSGHKTKLVPLLNETDIQIMLQMVCQKSDTNLENMVGVHKLIDLVFADT